MPAVSEKQRRWAAAVVHGDVPLPPGMTMAQAKHFTHKPRSYAGGGQVPMPPVRVLPRYAEGGATPPPAGTRGKPQTNLVPKDGRYWHWDGATWHDVGPSGLENAAAARAKAAQIPAAGAASAAPASSSAPAKPASTGNAIADLIIGKAKAFVLANGGAQADADAFARVAVAIASGESSLDPNAIRDTRSGNDPLVSSGAAQRELSVGLFQNNMMGGRGSGYSVEQLRDPNLNIDISLPQLWSAFQKNGGARAFLSDPVNVTARTYQQGQGSVAPSIQGQVLPGLAITGGGVSGVAPAQGGGTTTSGSAPATTTGTTNSALQTEFNAVNTMLTRQRNEYDALVSKPNKTNEEYARMYALEESLPIIRAQWADLYKAIQTPTGESPTQIALANSQIWSARQGALSDIFATTRQMIMDGFGAEKDKANFILDIYTTSFSQAAKNAELALQKGQLDLSGAVAVVEAQALQQTAEAARAMKAMEMAQLINANDWKLAERSLPAGTHYQPMFGPNDPLVVQMRNMGLGDASIRTTPLDTAKLDLRNTLLESPDLLTKMGYGAPNFNVAGVQGQYEANKGITASAGAPIDPEAMAKNFPASPDFSNLQTFLNLQQADVEAFNPFPPPTQTVANPLVNSGGGAGGGTANNQNVSTTVVPAGPATFDPAPKGAKRTRWDGTNNVTEQFDGEKWVVLTVRAGTPPNTSTANSFTGGAAGAVPPAWTNPGGTGAAANVPNSWAPAAPTTTGWGGPWGIPSKGALGWEVDPLTGKLRRKAA